MKKFSLKKKVVADGKVEKKVGGFSLKPKKLATVKDDKPKTTPIFGDHEEPAKSNNVIEITNINDITDHTAEEDKPLVIVPAKTNHLQAFLAKQAEQEKLDIKEQERQQKQEKQLGFGLNKLESDNDAIALTTPSAKDSVSVVGGKDVSDESYSKVPVSKFGLAMLRGMGWNEEMEKDRRKEAKEHHLEMKVREKKHAALSGLGSNT